MRNESVVDFMNEIEKEDKNFSKNNPAYYEPLAKMIQECVSKRIEKKLSQKDLAERMGTKQSVISRFENMGRIPNYDFIVRLANALDLNLKITLDGDNTYTIPKSQKKQITELAVKYNVSNEQVIKLLVSDAISDEYIEKLEWSEPKYFCNATYRQSGNILQILNMNSEIEKGYKIAKI